MCTLSLSDMGELRDDWLREPRPVVSSPAPLRLTEARPAPAHDAPVLLPDLEAAAA